MRRYRVGWDNGTYMYVIVIANNELEAMWKVQREHSSKLENIKATQVDDNGIEVNSYTGVICMTVWNTKVYRDYQGHNIIELENIVRSEHTKKAAEWIVKTLGEGDHRCIVKVNITKDDVSFELLDSKTIKD